MPNVETTVHLALGGPLGRTALRALDGGVGIAEAIKIYHGAVKALVDSRNELFRPLGEFVATYLRQVEQTPGSYLEADYPYPGSAAVDLVFDWNCLDSTPTATLFLPIEVAEQAHQDLQAGIPPRTFLHWLAARLHTFYFLDSDRIRQDLAEMEHVQPKPVKYKIATER